MLIKTCGMYLFDQSRNGLTDWLSMVHRTLTMQAGAGNSTMMMAANQHEVLTSRRGREETLDQTLEKLQELAVDEEGGEDKGDGAESEDENELGGQPDEDATAKTANAEEVDKWTKRFEKEKL